MMSLGQFVNAAVVALAIATATGNWWYGLAVLCVGDFVATTIKEMK